jgi:hypothetical protein
VQVCVQDFCEELEYWGLTDLHLGMGTKQNGFPVPSFLFLFDQEGCGKTKMNSLNSGDRFSSTSLMGDAHK